MTSALSNQSRVFKACLTQTKRVSDDVTRKIGPSDFKRDRVKSKRNSTIDFTLSAAMHRHTTRKDCLCAGEQEVATKRAFF